MRDDGTLVAHGVVGTRWRRRGARKRPTKEWPGMIQESLALGYTPRVDYLSALNVMVVYLPGGDFCMLTPGDKAVVQLWRGRGFESAYEIDDGVVLEGSVGRYVVKGFEELVLAARART